MLNSILLPFLLLSNLIIAAPVATTMTNKAFDPSVARSFIGVAVEDEGRVLVERQNCGVNFTTSTSTSATASPTSTGLNSTTMPTTTATMTTTTTTTSPSPSPTSQFIDAQIRSRNITAFGARNLRNNTNAIISWFHTSSTIDSTNGHSWCGFPYDDNTPGIAISLKTMLNNFNGSYETAAKAFCGMEVVVFNNAGYNRKLVIADAFDDRWVRTPNSVDMVYGAFTRFNKGPVRSKDVVQYGSWKFTGRRDLRYQFKGVGSGSG